jgi:hypothetical protein
MAVLAASPPKLGAISFVTKNATGNSAAAPNVPGFAVFQLPVLLRQLSYFDASVFI